MAGESDAWQAERSLAVSLDETDFIYDVEVDYSQHGKNWPADQCTNGPIKSPNRQSPINIDTTKTVYNENIRFDIEQFSNDGETFVEVFGNQTVLYVHY